jgi:hypothetical protein
LIGSNRDVSEFGRHNATRIINAMTKDRDDDSNASGQEQPDNEEASNDKNETDSGAADNERDLDKRGERPGNLRRRSEWFQKRHGGG